MPGSVALYRVDTAEDFQSIYHNVSAIDITETSPNETELRTWIRNATEIDENIFSASLHYHEEVYAPIEDSENWVAIEDAVGFGFIDTHNLVIFRKKKQADRIANKLNSLLYPNEQRIMTNTLSEEFMLRFMRENRHQAGLAFMRDMVLPNASHQAIYGGNVKESEIYKQALEYQARHGYVQMRLLDEGITIGISVKGSVVFYTNVDTIRIYQFIRDKILPLI